MLPPATLAQRSCTTILNCLDEAGIDYKTIVTWDDFEKAMKTYHDKTGKYMTYVETYGAYQFTILMSELGASLIDDKGMPTLNGPRSSKSRSTDPQVG